MILQNTAENQEVYEYQLTDWLQSEKETEFATKHFKEDPERHCIVVERKGQFYGTYQHFAVFIDMPAKGVEND